MHAWSRLATYYRRSGACNPAPSLCHRVSCHAPDYGDVTTPFDLDAYLRRIGYAGPRAPTLETLRAVHLRHTEAIPFENLDPFLRRPVRLDAESLRRKMVHGGRGGYCYEQNLLLMHALAALGFHAKPLAARVLWNAAVTGAAPPRTHMLLLLDVAGTPYIADAGFGVMTLTGPLRLETDTEQATPHEPYRLKRGGEEYRLEARIRGEWKTLYRFDLQEQQLPDFEIYNWYLSNHPESRFVTGLMAARAAADCRYTLHNNEFATHHLEGTSERRVLASVAQLREALTGPLRIKLPAGPEVDAALARLTAGAVPAPRWDSQGRDEG
jgi:N-hydroxyarylamine O-acetyltransferase